MNLWLLHINLRFSRFPIVTIVDAQYFFVNRLATALIKLSPLLFLPLFLSVPVISLLYFILLISVYFDCLTIAYLASLSDSYYQPTLFI
jgi:hypothetical protein